MLTAANSFLLYALPVRMGTRWDSPLLCVGRRSKSQIAILAVPVVRIYDRGHSAKTAGARPFRSSVAAFCGYYSDDDEESETGGNIRELQLDMTYSEVNNQIGREAFSKG